MEFSTNGSLLKLFEASVQRPNVVFHAAALCDFVVDRIDAQGSHSESRKKVSSDLEVLQITLVPAVKLLPKLHGLFPEALIVGWKYELDGSREDAIAKGWKQISLCQTDACVVNGSAYGRGFAFLQAGGELRQFPDKARLVDALSEWAAQRVGL